MEFVTIDVETANADMASICQIGMCHYKDGVIVDELNQYINPEDWFDPMNVFIHGITEDDVESSPTFSEIWIVISKFVGNKTVISHTSFDRTSFDKACRNNEINIDWRWSDTAKMLRRSMEEFRYKGYGLKNVCEQWGYEFKHHDALEDAKACGFILLELINRTQQSFEDLVKLASYKNNPRWKEVDFAQDINPEGPFFGQQICFTGELSVPRREACALACQAGFEFKKGVSKKIEYLVVGDQDITKLAGKNKSSKHIKAESLIKEGVNIRILKESDFFELIKEN